MSQIRKYLIEANQNAISIFFEALDRRLGRHVTRVVVIPLFGRVSEFASIDDAVRFIDQHKIEEDCGDFRKYEIRVEFSNGDRVEAFFEAKTKVKEFLAFVSNQ